MTTESLSMRPPVMSYIALMGRGLVLLVILALAAAAFAVNYWLGLGFLFLGLLVWILFGFKSFQGRNLLLLLYILTVATIISGSIVYTTLATGAASNQGNVDSSALMPSLVVGAGVSLIVLVLFLLVVAVAALGVLKWHKFQDVSFFQSFLYLLSVTLGLRYLWIIVDDKEIQGDENDKKRLETFGGPGWLTVYPGHVVVLHHWGKITRVVEAGSTMLKRHEKIKAVLSLEPAGGVNILDVLTKDRVPLTLTVLHAVRLEPAEATRERGGVAKDDRIIGDDYDQCYESIARLAAQKAPDMWGAVRFPIANMMKDLIMTCEFEELFSISQDGDDSQGLEVRANQRRLAEIEQTVYEKAKGFGLKKGVMLALVDINGIEYPEEIRDKINKEITAHLDAKMRQYEAKEREQTAMYEAQALRIEADALSMARAREAESQETAARYEAKAMVHLAKAEAEAESIKEEAKMQARTKYFQQVIEVLRQQGQSDDTIKAVLENLASSTALEDQLKRAIKITTQRQVANSVQKSINSG